MMTMTMIGNNSMVLCAHAFSLLSLSSTSSRQPNRFCNYKNSRPLITTTSLSSFPSSSLEEETSQKKEPKLQSLSLSSNLPSSDNTLSPEFYKSVYKDLQQQQLDREVEFSNNEDDDDNDGSDDDSIIIKTPWDIGGGSKNCRPQPAIVRAYKEHKIHGHVLDAGCGLGENCMYLAQQKHKYYGNNIKSITGFDFSTESIQLATDEMEMIITKEQEQEREQTSSSSSSSSSSSFNTIPNFITASCTDIADRHDNDQELFSAIKNYNSNNDNDNGDKNEDHLYFDVIIDSGLLHCLNDDDAIQYIDQMSKLLQPNTGKFYIGCFSTKNPDPWDNPRRINEDYIYNLFNHHHSHSHSPNDDNDDNDSSPPLWEVELIRDTWWARPPSRGSTIGGAFSLALWVEVRRTSTSIIR
jgi:SAM-dependent methyltransferase